MGWGVAAATGVSALGSIQQGNAAARASKYSASINEQNAKIAQQNADWTSAEGNINAGFEGQKTRAQVGAIKANQAASGIDVNKGSAPDVRAGAAQVGMTNALNIRAEAARRAYGYETQKVGELAQAGLNRMQAKQERQAGFSKATGTILGSLSNPTNSFNFGDNIAYAGNSLGYGEQAYNYLDSQG